MGEVLRGGGVLRKNSWTCVLPEVSARAFLLGIRTTPLLFVGKGVEMFSFDRASGSGEENIS